MSERWTDYLDANQTRFTNELLELLTIPSISTDPEYAPDVRRAAEWTANRLRQAGIEAVRIMETSGHPVVYGERLNAPDKPTLLFYGHFDVQPVDPLELWTSPPFHPHIMDGKVYARGASDMKGNLLLPIIACEALLQTDGELPVNVKFLYEGEEEIGSPSLAPFIADHCDLFACDLLVCADGGVGSADNPVVTVARRGLCALEIHVRSAKTDLHSGGAGGIAPNSTHALVRLLDSMRDADGRILVEGFYDDVQELTEADRVQIAASTFQPDAYKASTGIKDFFGEPEYTPQERNAARPSLEINGIWGGYQGQGIKTVIPCEAHAKITCRLVSDQTPDKVRELIVDHIRRFAPPQVDVQVEPLPGEADPYMLPLDHPALTALDGALTAVSAKPPTYARTGGTVPVTAMFKKVLEVDTVTLGASQANEREHAPNECYELANFERIQKAFCIFLQDIGQGGSGEPEVERGTTVALTRLD